jgi:dTDP-4-amino-4,6-dideoxygalactose transaminase
MKVPFLDLKSQYETIREEIAVAMQDVLENTAFAGGPAVAGFEKDFSAFCRCDEAIGVGSGTAALWLALLGLGVGEGDEVITVPNTFIATAEAISFTGAKPVFVDVEEKTFGMDPALIERAITPRTRAIIPVHLYGQPADMDPIMEVANAHGLYVVEDAAQAQGACYKGRPAGTLGDAGCFSFYPGKNLGAYGEAGGVVTNNADLAGRIRMLRDHGQSKKYYHSMIGWNSRMDGLQGAVLGVKLKHLPAWTDKRRQHASLYTSLLSGVDGIETPHEAEYSKHNYHIYALHTPHRAMLMKFLGEKGIASAMHYPVPVHLQEAYSSLGLKEGSYPVAERNAAEELSLPMFAELTSEQIESVAGAVKSCLLAAVR